MFIVAPGDLSDPRVIEMLQQHATRARAESAPGSAHALDPEDLRAPDIRFFAGWDRDELLGVGALRLLPARHAEIKSMYTTAAARGRGIGSAILARLLAEARAAGMLRVSLETGSWDYFEPARRFYRRHGFRDCPAFGAYRADPNSVFMTLSL